MPLELPQRITQVTPVIQTAVKAPAIAMRNTCTIYVHFKMWNHFSLTNLRKKQRLYFLYIVYALRLQVNDLQIVCNTKLFQNTHVKDFHTQVVY